MSIERIVLLVAGLMVMVSVALTMYVDPRFWMLTVFIGFNLFQSAITGFCPLAKILSGMGKKSGSAF